MVERRALTREAIVEAALAIADADGLDAVSMRSVAARLGVQAMSLYHHVPNKAALLDGLHERLVLSASVDGRPQTWDEALRATAHALRRIALDHPSLFVLLATRPIATAAEVHHLAALLAPLAEAGLDSRGQLFVMNLFVPAVNGLLLAEVAPVPGHPDVPEPDSVAAVRDAALGMGPGLADTLAVLTDESDSYFADRFDDHVDILLAGLAGFLGLPRR